MKNKSRLIFLIFTISFVLFLMVFMRIDSDYLWHIKAGEYMFSNHSILTHDIFSWTIPGTYWMSHEWGFEVIIYGLYLLFSKYNIFVYGLVCSLLLFLIIYFINRENIERNKLFGIIWLCLGFITSTVMLARPHMLSSIFLLLTCYFCYDLYNNEDSKKIFFLPIIAILWANIHGGSSNLVYLIPLIFIIASVCKFNFSKVEANRLSLKQINTYILIMCISFLCLNINPHGIKMIFYPYENMLNSTMLATISEWQPTVLNNGTHLMYFVLAFIIVLIFTLSKKKIRFIDGILFLFCLFLGLKSIRFWIYTYIIMSLVVFYYIPDRKDDKGTNIILILASCLFIFIFGYSFNKNIMVDTTKTELSDKFINTIKKENPNKLYNLYNLGGELIYNDIEVFIDGRADLYSKKNYNDSLDLTFLSKDFKKIMKKYDFDYYLVSSKYPLYYYLKDNKSYKLIYKEKEYYFYKKIKKEV
ncbi:MAG: hypothetical protein IJL76_02745 [Bacilli bacterium]|nr:hypothetical protein [Bacilli bacterium]